ncbi:MAG: gamma-glutamyl-gamma-aminobutyrate hydrolase family protein [Geminicoccaceae bacterium]
MTSAKPRILVFQHSIEAPLGVLAGPMAAAGAQTTVIECPQGVEVEDSHRHFDGLVVLGGVQCAADDANWPHLRGILDLIRHYRAAERPVLGICLGSQLIARALGGEVHPNRNGEFGRCSKNGHVDPLTAGLPDPSTSCNGAATTGFTTADAAAGR